MICTAHSILCVPAIRSNTIALGSSKIHYLCSKQALIMAIKILLIVSILLQLVATGIAIGQIRKTKYNSVWILFIVALLLMTVSRVLQFTHYVPRGGSSPWFVVRIWTGIATSLCLTVVLFYARKLVAYIDKLIVRRALTSKRILSTILRTEEKERSRFSKDLHDGLGSILAAAKYNFADIRKNGHKPLDMERYDTAVGLLDDSMREMRRVAHHLMPEALGTAGLRQSIADFCATVPHVKFSWYGDAERLDPNMEVIIYRIMHELVSNALNHSGAEHIIVQVVKEGGRISLTVQDDGRGFDPASPSPGMGLANIRARVAALNGNLSVDSRPGGGTEINVECSMA